MAKLRLGVICRYQHNVEELHWTDISNAEDCRAKVREWQDNECWENWQFMGGDVKNDAGEIVAIFSENGRIWKPGKVGNEYYEFLGSDVELSDADFNALIEKQLPRSISKE